MIIGRGNRNGVLTYVIDGHEWGEEIMSDSDNNEQDLLEIQNGNSSEVTGSRCGAYKEEWEWLGKPSNWLGCSGSPGHDGTHWDNNIEPPKAITYMQAKHQEIVAGLQDDIIGLTLKNKELAEDE